MGDVTTQPNTTWPADVIHVNEDGWVLINRGQRAGVVPGLRLLVVGTGVRELRNLFAAGSDGENTAEQPIVLRIRRTYEHLEVVYAEADCAVALATRTPPERRPSFYRGPQGELLVWVPLPEGYSYPPLDGAPEPDEGVTDDQVVDEPDAAEPAGDAETAPDAPPETADQEDARWEEALPLNGVAVGDIVVPATPVGATDAPGASTVPGLRAMTASQQPTTTSAPPANPFEAGQTYDWLKPSE